VKKMAPMIKKTNKAQLTKYFRSRGLFILGDL
jgi:hypothetical protein